METFSALLAICAGNSPVTSEFPTQRPVTQSFDAFIHLRLNKQLSKQSWGWRFETLWPPLWRRCNDNEIVLSLQRESLSWRDGVCIWNRAPGNLNQNTKMARGYGSHFDHISMWLQKCLSKNLRTKVCKLQILAMPRVETRESENDK